MSAISSGKLVAADKPQRVAVGKEDGSEAPAQSGARRLRDRSQPSRRAKAAARERRPRGRSRARSGSSAHAPRSWPRAGSQAWRAPRKPRSPRDRPRSKRRDGSRDPTPSTPTTSSPTTIGATSAALEALVGRAGEASSSSPYSCESTERRSRTAMPARPRSRGAFEPTRSLVQTVDGGAPHDAAFGVVQVAVGGIGVQKARHLGHQALEDGLQPQLGGHELRRLDQRREVVEPNLALAQQAARHASQDRPPAPRPRRA